MHGHGHGHHHHHPNHDHEHDHGHEHSAPRALSRALWVTVFFMFAEAAGGYWANSLALLSDSAHMLTDVGALLLSLFVNWMARRPNTRTMSFGYHRAEILGALASGLAIWAIAGILIYEAILRMSEPPEVKGPIVLVVATLGLGANLFGMRILHHAKDNNLNVRAAYLHMIADALGSVGAVIAGAVLWATGWRPIDPIITVLFSGLMLFGSWSLVREAIGVLMESTPGHVDPEAVSRDLAGIEGVEGVHDLHIWSLSSGRATMSVHLLSRRAEDVLPRAQALLREKYGLSHATVQIENPEKAAPGGCENCG